MSDEKAQSPPPMRLICYPTSGAPPLIRTAPVERDWMSATPEGFAYRCLPLNIANSHGWQILNPVGFAAFWTGGAGTDAVITSPSTSGTTPPALSHFGQGILTFHVTGLFRTEPGYDLWVGGPTNMFKDAIQPMSGVVETDWSPFTFTMNWKFTRANQPITFAEGEPFCCLFPIERGLVERVEPEFRSMAEDPEVLDAYTKWSADRAQFNKELQVPGSAAQAAKWQKDYFRGVDTGFGTAPADHRTKLKLKEFK
ncbi:hypothetical protein GCM10011611_01340 [Aliidongia dinghuensis]|uniref:Uncharacterized protein n=1 Tax=Aliidongia dinghuensis TaxID=1867774 RepID=A0A8J3E1F6_9PROT|nr:DUF6065 family protein [Aliidongia dinghuensis]GGE99476.1 hypothetical protein GCM10011611_01340 [Aliidongia dinghuensis]